MSLTVTYRTSRYVESDERSGDDESKTKRKRKEKNGWENSTRGVMLTHNRLDETRLFGGVEIGYVY